MENDVALTPILRAAVDTDAAAIASLYNHYINGTTITFEETPVSSDEIAARMQHVRQLNLPWFVAEIDRSGSLRRVIGWSYATWFRERVSYRYTVETAVYLDPAFLGHGYGKLLYRHLIEDLRTRNLHRAIGGIALPNPASVRLHEQLGFTHVGTFTEVGFKFNQWIDVGFWKLDLVRRKS